MKRILWLLFALLLLAACAGQTGEPPIASATEAPAVHSPAVETPAAEDEIAFVPPAPTEVPTQTPEPTAAPTPVPTPEPTATPAPFVACALPGSVRARNGFTASNLPGVVRRSADGAFFAYGSVGGAEPCFYPCDETGAVAPGEAPAEIVCTVPAYTPTEKPKNGMNTLLVVYLGSQSVVGYEWQDGDWQELRVMICSSGRKKHETPTGSFKIYDSYTYKVLGTADTHCYGFYACRFRTHHLFHSVPISYDAGRSQENGHRMCDMHKYEKLGTVASDGCVRLTVADAKWIYDLYDGGKTKIAVRIVKDAGPTPEKPPKVIWEEPYTDKNGYGWDPTDPDPNNPYLAVYTP